MEEAFKMKRPVRIGILPLESMKQEVLTAMFLHKSLKDSGSFPSYHQKKRDTGYLDIFNGLCKRGPLVGRLPPQLLNHLPLLLNTTRHLHSQLLRL